MSEVREKQPRFAKGHSGAKAVSREMISTVDGVSVGGVYGMSTWRYTVVDSLKFSKKEDLTGSQVWGHDEIISKYAELVKKILGPDHSMQQ